MIPAYESSSCVGSIVSIEQHTPTRLYGPIKPISVIESEEGSMISRKTTSSVAKHSSTNDSKAGQKIKDKRKESDLDQCSCIIC